jgi:cellulase/cellobiase CelA1
VFRSDDGGASWVRINDDAHQYGNIGAAITGDPRVYGRVYLATNGRGVLYADRVGGSTSSPTASPTSASPSPSPTSPSPSPTATGTGACTVKYTVVNQWPGGFQGDALIANKGSAAVNGWSLKWSFANGQVVSSLWNGSYTQTGAAVTVTNASWNGTIAPGGTADVGFQASWNNTTNAVPTAFTLNGTACGAG